MASSNSTAHSASFYYSVLLWAALLYGAGVVFKFGSVYLYESLMPWFSEDPVKPRTQPVPMPFGKAILWWGLGIYLLLSGLVSIPPQAAVLSHVGLTHLLTIESQRGLGKTLSLGFLSFWSVHPITYNIVVFMLQSVFGLFLITERDTLLGRISVVLTGLWGLLVAIFPQGLGYLFSNRHSIIAGAPGSGLLVAALAFLLLLPTARWKSSQTLPRWMGRVWTTLFTLGALVQLTFLRAPRLVRLYPTPPLLLPISGLGTITGLSRHFPILVDLFWTLLLALLALAPLARSRVAFFVAGLFIIVLWWFGQGFGLMAGFGLNLNTAPLWALILLVLYKSRTPQDTSHVDRGHPKS